MRHLRRSPFVAVPATTTMRSGSLPPASGGHHKAPVQRLQDGLSQFAPKTVGGPRQVKTSSRSRPNLDRILAPEPGHEADLPAQEAKARSDPRLPGADADAWGTLDTEAPTSQGPKAPRGLRMASGDAGARKR